MKLVEIKVTISTYLQQIQLMVSHFTSSVRDHSMVVVSCFLSHMKISGSSPKCPSRLMSVVNVSPGWCQFLLHQWCAACLWPLHLYVTHNIKPDKTVCNIREWWTSLMMNQFNVSITDNINMMLANTSTPINTEVLLLLFNYIRIMSSII